ncbi:LysE family translocator [Arhodomonas sp. AD133]|uniref:LysE family translocator n=1 Tax=Arhodomonas sp. AD133 TaxID=3415009 RepID=UPI003EBBC33F
MTESSLMPLAAFAMIATITPGGATTLATASGARFGLQRSVPLIAGIATGLALLGASAALGLTSLLMAIPVLERALRFVGSVYLLWLAWRIARSGRPSDTTDLERPVGLIGGALLLWLNPKAWAMALGAAATFTEAAASPLALALVLAGALGTAATISLALWSVAGAVLSRLLRTERAWRLVNTVLGVLLALSIIQIWR